MLAAESRLAALGTFSGSSLAHHNALQTTTTTSVATTVRFGTVTTAQGARNEQRIQLLATAVGGLDPSGLTIDQLLDCYEDVSRMVLNSPDSTSAARTYLLACRAFQVQPDSAVRLCCEANDILSNQRVSLVEEEEAWRLREEDERAERLLGADYWNSHKRAIEAALTLEENRRKQAEEDEREAALQEDYLYQNDKVVARLQLQLRATAAPESSTGQPLSDADSMKLSHLNQESLRIQKRIDDLRKHGIPSPCCDVCESHQIGREAPATVDAVGEEEEDQCGRMSRRDYFLSSIAENDTRCFIEDQESQDRRSTIMEPFNKSMRLMASILTTSGAAQAGWKGGDLSRDIAELSRMKLLPRLHDAKKRVLPTRAPSQQPSPPTLTKKAAPTTNRHGTFPYPCYVSGVYNQLALLVALPSCTRLKVLDLSTSRITSSVASVATQVLLRGGAMGTLHTLILDGNPVGSIAVEGLYSALQAHRSLRRLSLLSGPQGIPSTTRKIEKLCDTREAIGRERDTILMKFTSCEFVEEVAGRKDVGAEEVWSRRGLERMYASLLDGNTFALETDGTMKLSAVSLAALDEVNKDQRGSVSLLPPHTEGESSRPNDSRGSARTVASSDVGSSSSSKRPSSSSHHTTKSSKSKKGKHDKHNKEKSKSSKSKK